MVETVQIIKDLTAIRRQVATGIRGDDLKRARLPVLAQVGGDPRRPVGVILGAEHHQVILFRNGTGANSGRVELLCRCIRAD